MARLFRRQPKAGKTDRRDTITTHSFVFTSPLYGRSSMAMNPRLLRPLATGFNPKSIAGLQAWFDASDVSTLGPTSSGVGTVSNNGPVKFLRDKSGGGLDLSNPNADSVSPIYVTSSQNGLSAVSFDGGDWIGRTGSGVIMTAPFTLAIVCKANVVGTSRVCGVGSTRSIGPFASSNTQWGFFNAGGGIQSFGVSATAASVLAVTCNSSLAGVFYGNGTQSATGTISTMTPGGFGLGGDVTGAGTLNGLFYECLSYSAVLTASQVTALTRYLGRKWGITVG
jgi:hypothetical protein